MTIEYIKAIRYPELDEVEIIPIRVESDYYKSKDKGLLHAGFIFPISQVHVLLDIKRRLAEKQNEMNKIQAEIYKVDRKF